MTWENGMDLLRAIFAFVTSLFTGKKAVQKKADEVVTSVIQEQNDQASQVEDRINQAQLDGPHSREDLLRRLKDHSA